MDSGPRESFRILSLDGGGIRGLFTAGFFTHLQKLLSKSAVQGFDLIVGTSTGGIIALALAQGVEAAKVLAFYKGDGQKIFSSPRSLGKWISPKYKNEDLKNSLAKFFGDLRLRDSKVPVCICTHELVEGTPRVIKTDHSKDLHWGGDQLAWKVALATSAAPTYFPSVQIGDHDCYVDGGVWANNPVLVGVTEAVKYFGKELGQLRVLSVGTGSRAFRLNHSKAAGMGRLQWAKRGYDLILGAQSVAAHNQARLLLGANYLRIDADLERQYELDDYDSALDLIRRGEQAADQHLNAIKSQFY